MPAAALALGGWRSGAARHLEGIGQRHGRRRSLAGSRRRGATRRSGAAAAASAARMVTPGGRGVERRGRQPACRRRRASRRPVPVRASMRRGRGRSRCGLGGGGGGGGGVHVAAIGDESPVALEDLWVRCGCGCGCGWLLRICWCAEAAAACVEIDECSISSALRSFDTKSGSGGRQLRSSETRRDAFARLRACIALPGAPGLRSAAFTASRGEREEAARCGASRRRLRSGRAAAASAGRAAPSETDGWAQRSRG